MSSTPRAKAVSSTDTMMTMDVDGREVSNFILGMECSGFNERKGRESDDNATELDLWRVIWRAAEVKTF